ncbi:MAG TPA: hypothetical protein P5564_02235 [Paludibacteraceae bacterium]|nr:hypothetical protein [Paludibacteraceae bacterium]
MFSFLGTIFFFVLFIVLLVVITGISFIRSLFIRSKHQHNPMTDSLDEEVKLTKKRRKAFKKSGEYVDFEEVNSTTTPTSKD